MKYSYHIEIDLLNIEDPRSDESCDYYLKTSYEDCVDKQVSKLTGLIYE